MSSRQQKNIATVFNRAKPVPKPRIIIGFPIPSSFDTPVLTPVKRPTVPIRHKLRARIEATKKEFKRFSDWIVSFVPEPVKKLVSDKVKSLREKISKIYAKKEETLKEPQEIESAINKKVRTFRIDGKPRTDYRTFIQKVKKTIIDLIDKQSKPIKVRLVINCRFSRKTENNEKRFIESHFSTKNEVITLSTDLSEMYDIDGERLIELIDSFQKQGSGWVFEKVLYFDIHVNPFSTSQCVLLHPPSKILSNEKGHFQP